MKLIKIKNKINKSLYAKLDGNIEKLRPAQRAKIKREAIAEHFGSAVGVAGAPEANRYSKAAKEVIDQLDDLRGQGFRFNTKIDQASISQVVDLIVQAEWATKHSHNLESGVYSSEDVLLGGSKVTGFDYHVS